MAIKDKQGNLHSEKNGQFVSKNGESSRQKIGNSKLAEALTIYSARKRAPNVSLSKQEWALWYKAIGEIKRGMYVPTKSGKKLIEINNKIVVTSGTYVKPYAEYVLEFDNWEDVEEFLNDE
ncbi:MAG: hypothetical protein J6K52_04795 [Clostridia bacterium]|nr:hypothetical protein [Clostridia bacterium]